MAARKLEDEFGDIIAKARRGLGLSSVAGVSASELADIESYRLTPDRPTILKLAAALKLDGPKLAAIALDGWLPAEKQLSRWGNIARICSDYGGGTVNCYLHWDAERNAALFDTGVDADAVLQLLARHNLSLRAIFITHHHGDHVAALPEIRRAHPRAELRRQSGNIAALAVEAVNTPGHTADGITYIVRPGPVAYVGDSLFAGSVGAAGHSYAALLQNVRTHILSLPDDTLLCPGHGPLTTVAEEKAHNPFFP